MAIDQPRDHHASLAIKFLYFFSIRSEPWIAEQFRAVGRQPESFRHRTGQPHLLLSRFLADRARAAAQLHPQRKQLPIFVSSR